MLYIKKIKKNTYYSSPKIIAVGNLSLGGTGKTPLVIYLTKLLSTEKVVAILSRGYKRTSTGFKVINETTAPAAAGDEPYLLYKRFKDNNNVLVTVCENRHKGIANIMKYKADVALILLDDAFQQLGITPTLNILLTTFHQPFFKDHLLPLGRLREPRKGVIRAHMICVTKSPTTPSKVEITAIKKEIAKYHTSLNEIPIFFTHICYRTPILMWPYAMDRLPTFLLLITGIADPMPLRSYLESNGHTIIHLDFPDHHWFNDEDLLKIIQLFHALSSRNKAIVTTEKDSIRLRSNHYKRHLSPFPMFYIPIEIKFNQEDQAAFNAKIIENLLF